MSTFVWILLAALYLTALAVLGVTAIRKGHIMLFCVGIFFPILWLVGAVIAPTPRMAAAEARGGTPLKVKRTRYLLILGLLASLALSAAACGDDDASTSSESSGEAVAPPPSTAFDGLTTALEGQGLVVGKLPKVSLDGAQAGVKISGDKSGSARSFGSKAKASAYADQVSADGDKTTIVGTVVLEAPTQADADFFADAYEG